MTRLTAARGSGGKEEGEMTRDKLLEGVEVARLAGETF